jgi:hypothetical protein
MDGGIESAMMASMRKVFMRRLSGAKKMRWHEKSE